MDVTTEDFEREVIERSSELPVIVDFWAEWCGPCKSLTPVLEQEIAEREGKVVLAKVDVDANRELAEKYEVRGGESLPQRADRRRVHGCALGPRGR